MKVDVKQSVVDGRLQVQIDLKGDLPGHPFRGNQWEGEQGEQDTSEGRSSSEAAKKFLHRWTWENPEAKVQGRHYYEIPPDDVTKELSSCRPEKPLTLYRSHIEGRGHDPLESWTTSKELADDITDFAEGPKRVTLRRRVHPSEMLYSADHVPSDLKDEVLPTEVVVAHGKEAKRITQLRGERYERGQLTNGDVVKS